MPPDRARAPRRRLRRHTIEASGPWAAWPMQGRRITPAQSIFSANDAARSADRPDVGPDRLDLGVQVEHLMAHLASPTRLLEPPERCPRSNVSVGVDPNRSGTQTRCDTVRP